MEGGQLDRSEGEEEVDAEDVSILNLLLVAITFAN